MSNIVISGYYGFGNAGDEAMLCAIIDAIRKEEADAHITVISGNPKETSKKHNINAVGTFSAFGILKAIANSDLVISGGGSLLQDATSIRNTYYYLSIMSLANDGEKSYALFPRDWTFESTIYSSSCRFCIAFCRYNYSTRLYF